MKQTFVMILLMVLMVAGFLMVDSTGALAEGISNEMLEIMHNNGDISDETYRQLQEMADAEKLKKTSKTPLGAYWDNGIRLKSEDNVFKIKIGGRILNDWGSINADDEIKQAFSGETVNGNGTEMRQARFYMSGTIYNQFIFNAEYDFAGTDADFTDVWVGMNKIPGLGEVRIGHQKEPFSLERMNSIKYTTFIERGLPVVFAPGRNTGIKFHNSLANTRLAWGIGGYKEVKTSDGFDDLNNYNITARLTGVPWMTDNGEELIHLGLSYSHKFSDKDQSYRYRMFPESHLGPVYTLDTDSFGDVTDVDLVSPEIAVVLGPFSVQSEYVRSLLSRDNSQNLDFSGYYVFCSYFLTGEHRQYIAGEGGGEFGRIIPARPFSMDSGGWGSWQVALRYSYTDLNDREIWGGKEGNYTAGINWYLNANLRLALNYIRAELDDRERTVNGETFQINNERMDIVMMRCQVDF
jgi:phosphate-selective porin OprO/OprP